MNSISSQVLNELKEYFHGHNRARRGCEYPYLTNCHAQSRTDRPDRQEFFCLLYQPKPEKPRLVKDTAAKWRTGKLAKVFEGDFDLME